MNYEEWLRRIIVVVVDEHKMTEEEKEGVLEKVKEYIMKMFDRRTDKNEKEQKLKEGK